MAIDAKHCSEADRKAWPRRSYPAMVGQTASDPRTGMALAYLTGDYAMKAIADVFDVHYTTLSRAVKAYELGHGW